MIWVGTGRVMSKMTIQAFFLPFATSFKVLLPMGLEKPLYTAPDGSGRATSFLPFSRTTDSGISKSIVSLPRKRSILIAS